MSLPFPRPRAVAEQPGHKAEQVAQEVVHVLHRAARNAQYAAAAAAGLDRREGDEAVGASLYRLRTQAGVELLDLALELAAQQHRDSQHVVAAEPCRQGAVRRTERQRVVDDEAAGLVDRGAAGVLLEDPALARLPPARRDPVDEDQTAAGGDGDALRLAVAGPAKQMTASGATTRSAPSPTSASSAARVPRGER